MKKIINNLLKVLCFAALLFLVACDDTSNITVSFESNGANEVVESINLTEEGTITLPSVTKDGYRFDGWFTEVELIKEFTSSTTVSEDIKLYAKWTEVNCKVTFVTNCEEKIDEMTVSYNSKLGDVSLPVNAGYVFKGWFIDAELTEEFDVNSKITSDITLYALWEGEEVIYSFMSNNSPYEALILNVGQDEQKPSDPVLEGYTFIGWELDGEAYDFSGKVLGEKEFTAKFEINKYTYKFVNWDGTVLKEETINYRELIVAPTLVPTKEETTDFTYEFDSWDKEIGLIKEDITFTALFTETQKVFYNIKFMNEDKSLNKEITVLNTEKVESFSLEKEADSEYRYEFDTWYTDEALKNKYDFEAYASSDVVLYPKFNAIRTNLKGAKISFLGDSITTFYSASSSMNSYYSGENQYYYPLYSVTIKNVSQTWWAQLLANTETTLGINNSWSGSTCYNHGSDAAQGPAMNYNRINTLNEAGQPDIVIIFIGTNDNVNGFTVTVFSDAFKTMVARVREVCPNATIFACTMGYSNYENTPSHYSYKESTRYLYNKKIKELAPKLNFEVIDFASVITTETYKEYLGDNLHPSYAGATAMATYAATVLKEYYNK